MYRAADSGGSRRARPSRWSSHRPVLYLGLFSGLFVGAGLLAFVALAQDPAARVVIGSALVGVGAILAFGSALINFVGIEARGSRVPTRGLPRAGVVRTPSPPDRPTPWARSVWDDDAAPEPARPSWDSARLARLASLPVPRANSGAPAAARAASPRAGAAAFGRGGSLGAFSAAGSSVPMGPGGFPTGFASEGDASEEWTAPPATPARSRSYPIPRPAPSPRDPSAPDLGCAECGAAILPALPHAPCPKCGRPLCAECTVLFRRSTPDVPCYHELGAFS